MTDRDHFAAAALTGLLAASDANSWADDLWADDLCRTAYGWADFMLRERGNHPATPDSSPVTEPMPKEKLAEVSARIDGVDHPVPYSRTDEKRVNWPTIRDTTQPRKGAPAEGSVQGEGTDPVAWLARGAEYDTGCEYEFVTLLKEQADASENYGGTVVPLYRAPKLTGAEREAVEFAAARMLSSYVEEREIALALSGLLERLGGGE